MPQTYGVVTLPDNAMAGSGIPGYQTTPGYDATTGWGSPRGDEYVQALVGDK